MSKTERKVTEADRLIGQQIELVRLTSKRSRKSLAKQLDISPSQLQKYEKGQSRITAGRLVQIAKALKCNAQHIIPDEAYYV